MIAPLRTAPHRTAPHRTAPHRTCCNCALGTTTSGLFLFYLIIHHYDDVHEVLGVHPVHWSSRWSWSLHLFLGRPMFLRPFGLYCNACLGILSVSILCMCCSHFSWYCFISFISIRYKRTVPRETGANPVQITGTWQPWKWPGATQCCMCFFCISR